MIPQEKEKERERESSSSSSWEDRGRGGKMREGKVWRGREEKGNWRLERKGIEGRGGKRREFI